MEMALPFCLNAAWKNPEGDPKANLMNPLFYIIKEICIFNLDGIDGIAWKLSKSQFWQYFGPSKIANHQFRNRQNSARNHQNRGMGPRAH